MPQRAPNRSLATAREARLLISSFVEALGEWQEEVARIDAALSSVRTSAQDRESLVRRVDRLLLAIRAAEQALDVAIAGSSPEVARHSRIVDARLAHASLVTRLSALKARQPE
jgi:hypothetical protein